MASVSTLAPARDGHDPWGFGLTAADDVVCIDRLQPPDEVADPEDVAAAFRGARPWRAALVPVPASESAFDPAPLADAAPAVAAGPASPRPASVLRLPFSPERAGVMALDAAYGLGADRYLRYPDEIAAVTAEQVQEVARRVIDAQRSARTFSSSRRMPFSACSTFSGLVPM